MSSRLLNAVVALFFYHTAAVSPVLRYVPIDDFDAPPYAVSLLQLDVIQLLAAAGESWPKPFASSDLTPAAKELMTTNATAAADPNTVTAGLQLEAGSASGPVLELVSLNATGSKKAQRGLQLQADSAFALWIGLPLCGIIWAFAMCFMYLNPEPEPGPRRRRPGQQVRVMRGLPRGQQEEEFFEGPRTHRGAPPPPTLRTSRGGKPPQPQGPTKNVGPPSLRSRSSAGGDSFAGAARPDMVPPPEPAGMQGMQPVGAAAGMQGAQGMQGMQPAQTSGSIGVLSDHGGNTVSSVWGSERMNEQVANLRQRMQDPPAMCGALVLPRCEAWFAVSWQKLEENNEFELFGLSGRPLLRASISKEPHVQELQLSMFPSRSPMLGAATFSGQPGDPIVIRNSTKRVYGTVKAIDQGHLVLSHVDTGREICSLKCAGSNGHVLLESWDGTNVSAACRCHDSDFFSGLDHLEVRVYPGGDAVLVLCCILGVILFRKVELAPGPSLGEPPANAA